MSSCRLLLMLAWLHSSRCCSCRLSRRVSSLVGLVILLLCRFVGVASSLARPLGLLVVAVFAMLVTMLFIIIFTAFLTFAVPLFTALLPAVNTCIT
jgi:hypothetical protein